MEGAGGAGTRLNSHLGAIQSQPQHPTTSSEEWKTARDGWFWRRCLRKAALGLFPLDRDKSTGVEHLTAVFNPPQCSTSWVDPSLIPSRSTRGRRGKRQDQDETRQHPQHP